jgi:hypothetical protein
MRRAFPVISIVSLCAELCQNGQIVSRAMKRRKRCQPMRDASRQNIPAPARGGSTGFGARDGFIVEY